MPSPVASSSPRPCGCAAALLTTVSGLLAVIVVGAALTVSDERLICSSPDVIPAAAIAKSPRFDELAADVVDPAGAIARAKGWIVRASGRIPTEIVGTHGSGEHVRLLTYASGCKWVKVPTAG